VFEPFIAGRIDENLITAHWDDVSRLATSVRTGAASASLLLKRLGAYPRQNGLALALREIGRIERSQAPPPLHVVRRIIYTSDVDGFYYLLSVRFRPRESSHDQT
jgi:hypothetical protein